MKIMNTSEKILRYFWEKPFDLAQWERYVGEISPTLAEKCRRDAETYSFEREVLPVIQNTLAQQDKMTEASRSFDRVTAGLEDRVRRVLGADVDVTIILYLGLCNGAGWATQLDGASAVLLGIEKIVELNWCGEIAMAGLLFHEMGHLWHFQNRKAPWFEETDPALWQLYTEGIAMLCEQELAGDPNFMHQYDGKWHNWCRENERALFREYRARVDRRESVQDFFGDWCSYQGHSDVGYYLGAVLIRRLSESLDRQELANCGSVQIYEKLKEFAEAGGAASC